MAIYRCEIKPITRPQSIVGKIAYRTGEKIESIYTGETFDYRRKSYIISTEILLPPQAPKEYSDRAKLWNSVEMAEKSINSKLGKEILVSLPCELPLDAQKALIREFAQDTFVSKGLCCDIAIHNPPVRDDKNRPIDKHGNPTNDESEMIFRNPHVHIVISSRPLDENGNWMQKAKTEYICINPDGVEKCFTTDELKITSGWEKQYKYITADGSTQWMTKALGDEAGYERVNRYPKQTKYGRQSDTMKYLSSPAFVKDIRISWERYANKFLERAGVQERIDHRSYEEQGLSRIPCIKMDIATINMDKRADRKLREGVPEDKIIRSDIAQVNRLIRQYNTVIAKIESKIAELKDPVTKTAKELENLREKIIFSRCQKKKLVEQSAKIEQDIEALKIKISNFEERMNLLTISLNHHQDRAKVLTDEIKSLTKMQFAKKNALQKELSNELKMVDDFTKKIKETKLLYGYSSSENLDNDKSILSEAKEKSKTLDEQIADITKKEKEFCRQYMIIKSTISKQDSHRISDVRLSLRSLAGGGGSVFGSLYNLVSRTFDENDEERKRHR